MTRVRTRPVAENRVKCSYCEATVKEKFRDGHEAGCTRNPGRDRNLPARERKAKP